MICIEHTRKTETYIYDSAEERHKHMLEYGKLHDILAADNDGPNEAFRAVFAMKLRDDWKNSH